jgi:hypothetical protein
LCSASAGTLMPKRRLGLLGRLAEADCFAWTPGKFAGSPRGPTGPISQILSGSRSAARCTLPLPALRRASLTHRSVQSRRTCTVLPHGNDRQCCVTNHVMLIGLSDFAGTRPMGFASGVGSFTASAERTRARPYDPEEHERAPGIIPLLRRDQLSFSTQLSMVPIELFSSL